MRSFIIILFVCLSFTKAFVPIVQQYQQQQQQYTTQDPSSFATSTAAAATTTTTDDDNNNNAATVSIDPTKEVVKLFGRLADKYILLDASGGMCCYSACTDCEYRLPDGGYRMADQSASRPKWICSYDERRFEASGKAHTSKWKLELYGDQHPLAVTKDEFIAAMVHDMTYAPPLGGPYVGASAATIEDTSTAARLFDLLAGEKETLTRHRMGTRIQ